MSCPSVVCLSSVTLLNPKQKLELFGNIFVPPNSSGTQTVCVTNFGQKFEGVLGYRASEIQGCIKNSGFSNNISLYSENGTRYGHSYNGRRIGTRMRSIDWCHLQWPWIIRHPERFTRWIKEAIHIRKEGQQAMNRDEGSYQLSHAYDRFLDTASSRLSRTGRTEYQLLLMKASDGGRNVKF